MIDESCDLGVEKKLVICVRYVINSETSSLYLGSVSVNDGKAHTITRHVIETLQIVGLDLSNMVGLGTDGADTMTGHKNGVGGPDEKQVCPFCNTSTHCFAHRLNLACVDAMKEIQELDKFRSMFNALYIHFSTSAVRNSKLKEIQTVFEDSELKIKEPHQVRWLSLRDAVKAVYKCYPSVVACVSELAESNSTAKALYTFHPGKQ